MCHFVTAVLPASAPHAELDAVAHKHGRQLCPLASPSIERQIRSDQRYFLTTIGHCDCGTVLGSDNACAARAPDWAVEEQRLLKKGWSKAKISRALAQKQKCFITSDQAAQLASAAELRSWADLISEVLDSGAREFGLLLHSYRGPLDEDIQLKGVEHVVAGVTTGETLRQMREDVLYLFGKGLGNSFKPTPLRGAA